MTVSNPQITFDSSSDALFRVWGSALAAAIAAMGLVQAADTGQINWTTVTRTGIGSQAGEFVSGYEIYRFNDALQATKPVFVKFEYGHTNHYNASTATNNTGSPTIFVTVGTASNGSGTLTGLVSVRHRLTGGPISQTNQTGGSTPRTPVTSPCYFMGDGSSFCWALGATTAAQPIYSGISSTTDRTYSSFPSFLVIERSRNADGTANGDGLIFATSLWTLSSSSSTPPPSATHSFQAISFTGSGVQAAPESYWPFAFPGTAFQSGAAGADLYTWPLVVATPKAQAQALAGLGIYAGEVALGSTISVLVNGASHTYISMSGIAGLTNNDAARGQISSIVAPARWLMRYE